MTPESGPPAQAAAEGAEERKLPAAAPPGAEATPSVCKRTEPLLWQQELQNERPREIRCDPGPRPQEELDEVEEKEPDGCSVATLLEHLSLTWWKDLQRQRAGAPNPWHALVQGVAEACREPLALCEAWCQGPAGVQEACDFLGAAEDEQDRRSRERLRLRLDLYGVEERPIRGDGNCQFASVSDQLYGTPRRHPEVRAAVVRRLRSEPELYSPYVPGQSYDAYVEEIAGFGAWGDHVTLQALADALGVRVVVVTSFTQEAILEIRPRKDQQQSSGRVLWLSFCAEVHYSSLYPKGRAPLAREEEVGAETCPVC